MQQVFPLVLRALCAIGSGTVFVYLAEPPFWAAMAFTIAVAVFVKIPPADE